MSGLHSFQDGNFTRWKHQASPGAQQLSLEYQQLKFIIQVQENFVLGALIRGSELERQYLLYIVEQLEVLILKTQQVKDKVEKLLYEGGN